MLGMANVSNLSSASGSGKTTFLERFIKTFSNITDEPEIMLDMANASNLTRTIIDKMSKTDLREFNMRSKPKKTLIENLELFLHEKYCNAENTPDRERYGRLCNLVEYPGRYVQGVDCIYILNISFVIHFTV